MKLAAAAVILLALSRNAGIEWTEPGEIRVGCCRPRPCGACGSSPPAQPARMAQFCAVRSQTAMVTRRFWVSRQASTS